MSNISLMFADKVKLETSSLYRLKILNAGPANKQSKSRPIRALRKCVQQV